MAGVVTGLESLYKVRKGAVDIVDVPELGYAMVDGVGAPMARSSPPRYRRCTR
jgi:hypothetical protein